DARASAATLRRPNPSPVFARRRCFTAAGPGEASKTWSLPRSTGSGGSITTASSSRLGILPRSSMRRPTGAGRQLSRNRCHSSKQVSEKIGAVHVSIGDIMFARGDLRRHKSPHLWKPGRDSACASRYARQGRLQGRDLSGHRSPGERDDGRVGRKSGASASGRTVDAGGRREGLGLLVAALGADPDHPFPIKIGGGKPVGLGSVLINSG